MGQSKSSKYYAANPEAKKKKNDYMAEYNKKPEQRKKRAELNQYNRDKGTYGNGDGKDASHKGGKISGMEAESKNRARHGKGSTKPGNKRSKK